MDNRHRRVTAVGILLSAVAVGCGESRPVGPTPVTAVRLVLSETSVLLARHGEIQLRATLVFGDDRVEDVTASASWGSSAPEVASVDRGLVRAGAALGTVRVFAQQAGHLATATVTLRRNLRIAGEVTVRDADGQRRLSRADVMLDRRHIGSLEGGETSGRTSLTVSCGTSPVGRANGSLDPAAHELSVDVLSFLNIVGAFDIDATSTLEVIDRDTGEVLDRIPLRHDAVTGTRVTLTVRFDVASYTS